MSATKRVKDYKTMNDSLNYYEEAEEDKNEHDISNEIFFELNVSIQVEEELFKAE